MRRHIIVALLVCLVPGIPLYWLELNTPLHFGIDWDTTYYPATRLLLQGANPYVIPSLHNPVWALLPLIPLVLLGSAWGKAAMFFATLFSYTFVAQRANARPFTLILLVLSPLVLYAASFGNIDWLVLYGFILPPPIGIFLLVLKPQLSIVAILFLAVQAWRSGRLKGVLKVCLPVTLALAASFLPFGNWISDRGENLVGDFWNTSPFPWSIPVALVLTYLSLRAQKFMLAVAASPFVSPYVTISNWSVCLFALLKHNRLMFGTFVGTWTFVIMSAVLRHQL